MNLFKRFLQGLIILVITGCSLATTPNAQAANTLNPPYTSVQLFKWSWNDIATECTQWLGPQGYGGVQISPPSASMSNGNWWDIYQPVNYTSFTSVMGNASQLQNMINTCHAAGVRVYADIVVNQMAGGSGTATDGSTWNANSNTALQYPNFSTSDFHPYCAIASSDYNNNTYNVQHCWLVGLPDLATENSHVQGQIENYMETLIGMGVDGFRMDAAKHQQEDQLAIIFNAVHNVYPTTKEGEQLFVTQEIIPDGEVNRASYEALGTLNEFQFVYAMQSVFRNTNGNTLSSIPYIMGTPGNWGGSWGFLPSSNSAQIFIDDWDTERNSGGSLNASDYVGGETNDAVGTYRYDLGNIFMLAQPYGVMAQVQSGFRFTGDNQDMPSSSAFSNGVAQVPTSRSQNSGWDFIHRWPDISNMVKFRTATYGLGESNWVVGTSNQIAFSRGNVGFVALNNDSTTWNNTFQTGLPAGTYCNVVNGVLSGSTCTADTVTVNSSGDATLSIPANGGGSSVPAVAIYTGQMQGGSGGGTQAPAAPTGLAGVASGSTTVNLSWTADSGATSYTVYRSTSTTSGFTSVGTSTGTTFSNAGLAASTTYYYYLTASNSSGTSGSSSTISVTTSGSGGGGGGFTSPWTTMYLRGTMNGWATTAMALVANDTWQATVTLSANTAYSYKMDASGSWTTNQNWGASSTSGVAALNAGNISYTTGTSTSYVFTFNDSTLAYSVTASGGSSPTIPSTPTGVTPTVVSSSQINLNWTASTGATSYTVYRSTSSTGPFTSVGTPTTTTFSDTGLTASTTYYYEVAAVNSAGASANSAAVNATTAAGGTCTTVAVTFTITNAGTVFGQNVYVAGNQTALGNWAPASAFALTIQGSGANVPWTGTVQLPPNTAIQYKYIKYDPSTGANAWESGSNRTMTTAACGSTSTFNDGNF